MVKMIEENYDSHDINIKVAGVGNAGGNIVSRIAGKALGITSISFNTDAVALKKTRTDLKIQLGARTTHGRGTGRDPEKGKFAANEDNESVKDALKNTDILFLVAGLGGGTGTGSSPVIAKMARDMGTIVIAITTTPFDFEGVKRVEYAKNGLDALQDKVDTLIHIPNQKLYDTVGDQVTFADAFDRVDEVIYRTVASIADLLNKQKLLDIDFADICSIVQSAGKGMVGLGHGKGEGRTEKAAVEAMENPLLEKSDMMESKNILISITGSPDFTMKEVGDAMRIIQSRISSPSIVLGISIDEDLDDEVKIMILATGIGGRTRPHQGTRPSAQESKKPEEGQLPLDTDIDRPAYIRNNKKKGADFGNWDF